MEQSGLARLAVGLSVAAAMGVATISSAATASAQIAITASSAYCVGSTYTLTVPAAEAAALIAQAPNDDQIGLSWSPASGGSISKIGTATYMGGKDIAVQWTPTAAGTVNFQAYPVSSTAGWTWNVTFDELLGVTVVQSAPSGTTCTPASTTTGSANSIPVIGGLLSSLSAQK